MRPPCPIFSCPQQGDHGAFSELLVERMPRLYGVAGLVTGSRDRAEDAVQETLIHAWRVADGQFDVLTEDGGTAPLWSPDGSHIAYNVAPPNDIRIVEVQTGAIRNPTGDEWTTRWHGGARTEPSCSSSAIGRPTSRAIRRVPGW